MTQIIDWGLISYGKAFEQQTALFQNAIDQKQENKPTGNCFVLCEHPHVITIGKHGLFSNLLFPEEALKEKNVELFHIDRGGDVTYHGPGQIVGYPILDLERYKIGLKEYIHRIEEVIICTLADYQLKGFRLNGATGVWLDPDTPTTRKVAAIGVRCSRYITMHGFALNVNTDLDYFRLINPCGFVDKGVTSMAKELGKEIKTEEVKNRLIHHFKELFEEKE